MADGARITDHEGVQWEVQEVSRLDDPAGNGPAPSVHPSWLAFRSPCGLRLLRRYPRNWESLSAAELHQLFLAATPQPPVE